MLKGVPKIISPELLKVLAEMGHSDVLCIGDGNFPADRFAREGDCKIVRADGLGSAELLEAVLELIPTDAYVETPVMLMRPAERDKDMDIKITKDFERIVSRFDDRKTAAIGYYERQDFYDHAKKSYCIIQSGEEQVYANVMIQKGVIQ